MAWLNSKYPCNRTEAHKAVVAYVNRGISGSLYEGKIWVLGIGFANSNLQMYHVTFRHNFRKAVLNLANNPYPNIHIPILYVRRTRVDTH